MHLYQQEKLELLACPTLRLVARPDESSVAFQARVHQLDRESRDQEIQSLRAKYDPKLQQLQGKLSALDEKLAREEAEASAKQVDTAAAFGGALLGALMGRSVATASNVRRGASVVRSAGRAKKEVGDVARALESNELCCTRSGRLCKPKPNARLASLHGNSPAALEITGVQLSPRKADTDVGTLTLFWLPFRREPSGNATYAFSIA